MSDSDESLNTEDLNEINSIDNKTYEDIPVKSVERSKQIKRIPVEKEIVEKETEVSEEPLEKSKPLKKARSEKQIQNIANLVKNRNRNLQKKKL